MWPALPVGLYCFCTSSHAVVIEEIMVTARKKEETLQQVPLSVAAFDTRALQDRNIDNAYDLADYTPNFQFNRNIVGRRLDAPNIRGQFSPLLGGSPAQGGANAAFFIDGVYVSGTGGTQAVANLERVEILRGPQAAQFGRATFAGAVNYVTKRPSNDFEGEIFGRIGENEDYKTSVWLSGPIVENRLLFFASGSYETRGAEWQNELIPCQPGQNPDTDNCTFVSNATVVFWPSDQPPSANRADFTELGGEATWDVTGKLTWLPTENLEINLKASYGETDDDHYAIFYKDDLNCFRPGDPIPSGGTAPSSSPGWYCGKLTIDGLRNTMNIADMIDGATSNTGTARPAPFVGVRSETERYLVEAVYEINEWEIIGRYSHNVQTVETYRDLDRGPGLGPLTINVFDAGEVNEFDDDSLELRIASPSAARFRASLGAYYYEADELAFQRDFTGVCRFNFGDPRIGPNGQELYEDLDGPAYQAAPKSPIANGNVKNTAVFGSLEWDIRDDLTLAFETRWAEDEVSRKSARGASAKDTFDSFTPRYTLTYRASNDVMVYGLAAKGTKPGGLFFAYFDVDVARDETNRAVADGRAAFAEEKAWTYEIGTKTNLFGGRLLFNASAFYIDWTNQGINEVDNIPVQCGAGRPGSLGPLPPEPNNILTNAGESRVIGAELEMQLAVTDNLSMSMAYGLADTKLEQFNSLTYADLTGISDPDLLNGGNVSGNEAPRVPQHSVNLSGVYTRALGNWGATWFARMDYLWEDKQWISAVNHAYIDATHTLNARIGIENDNWLATLFIDNLTDEDAPTLTSDFPNFTRFPSVTTSFPLQPRRGKHIGATLSYRFGR